MRNTRKIEKLGESERGKIGISKNSNWKKYMYMKYNKIGEDTYGQKGKKRWEENYIIERWRRYFKE